MFKKKNNELEINNDIAMLVKEARLKKGLSARKLAELCDISHTEINNIERGIRVKPAILTLKGFEKYLDLPFEQTAKLVGYSDVTIEYGEENIIVSYEKYDKMREQYKTEFEHMQHFIEQKRHLGMDIEEYFSVIHKYLKEQENIKEDVLNKAEAIEKFLKELQRKYEFITKEK